MGEGNWIKISRKIRNNIIWDFKNPKYAMAWIDILLMANYKDRKILFNGMPQIVKRGTFKTSIVKLSERWEMNRRTVKRFLDLLEAEEMIKCKIDNKSTTIKVVNYDLYQGLSDEKCTAELSSECTAKCTTECTADKASIYKENQGFLDTKCTTECTTECTAKCTAECTQHKNILNNNIKRKEEKKKINYQEIVDLYNDTCVSLPSVTKLTDARKRAIKSRLNNYTKDELKEAFAKAEASDFLKGNTESPRKWNANFDWLIKESNIVKVLEGNFDNKSGKKINKFNDFSQRNYSAQELQELELKLLRK